MKAVKNLIVEQISVIKLQKGCISLYPKSIMNLVFSEVSYFKNIFVVDILTTLKDENEIIA